MKLAEVEQIQDRSRAVGGMSATHAVIRAAVGELPGLENENRRLAYQVGYLEEKIEKVEKGFRRTDQPSLASWLRRLRAWISSTRPRKAIELVLLVLLLFFASRPLIRAFRVEGVSMVPT